MRISVDLGVDAPDDAIEWSGESTRLTGTLETIELLLGDGRATGRAIGKIAHRLIYKEQVPQP